MAARAGRHTLGQQDAPPAPTRAARAQQPPRHHSTAHSRSRHSISSWPQLIFRRQPLYRRASGPGARCSTGRARPGPRRRGPASGLRESPPHRSLAGLEAGSSRDSWCAGCRPLPSPHSPLGTRGSWGPGADPSEWRTITVKQQPRTLGARVVHPAAALGSRPGVPTLPLGLWPCRRCRHRHTFHPAAGWREPSPSSINTWPAPRSGPGFSALHVV